jgi:hypothetical protein
MAFLQPCRHDCRHGGRRSQQEAARIRIGGDQALHFVPKLGFASAGFIEKRSAAFARKLDGFDKDASNTIVTVRHEVARLWIVSWDSPPAILL